MIINMIEKLNHGLYALWYVRFEPMSFWTMISEIWTWVPGLKILTTAEKKNIGFMLIHKKKSQQRENKSTDIFEVVCSVH